MPKPTEVTLAIREALQALNDIDAATDEVRSKVVELHPDLEDASTDKRFSAQVSAQRRWLRDNTEQRKPAPKAKRAAAPAVSTYELYQMAQKLWEYCGGNAKMGDEILGFLTKADPADIERAWAGWKALVASAGGMQNARRILEIQKQTGMIE